MWTKPLLKSKARALAAHLIISALLFLPIVWLICFRWFPPPFFYTDGGWQGVRIMLMVDMVLGPALTFLVFDPAKTRRALTVDFSFIAIVQAVALAYGAITIENGRLRAVVFAEDAFYAVAHSYFVKQGVTPEQWDRFGDAPQAWVYLRRPLQSEMPRYLEAVNTKGYPMESLFFLYEPLSAGLPKMQPKAVKLEQLLDKNPDFKQQYEDFLGDYEGDASKLQVYRFYGAFRSNFVVLDEGGRFVGSINVDPRQLKH